MGPKNRKKIYTVMIIPHSEKSTLTFNIPLWCVQVIGFITVGIVVTALVFTGSYHTMKARVAQLQKKYKDYKILREQLDYFAGETEKLQEKMKMLEKLDTDIRTIMKNDPAIAKINKNMEEHRTEAVMASRGGSDRSNRYITAQEKIAENLQVMSLEMQNRESSLTELKSAVTEREARLQATPSIWPVKNPRITSKYGYRRSPFGWRREFHHGIDLATYYGAPIYATADGVVVFAGWKSGYGRTIIISNKYGFTTLYGHNSKNLVKKGDIVKKGDVIARVGNSGRSTGPHLHYEVHVNGKYINPMEYLP